MKKSVNTSSHSVLKVSNLTKDFSGIRAVNQVSFELSSGSITAVIGPNGAGKTTLYNLLSGNLAPTSGSVKLEGKEIVGLTPDRIVQAGIGRSFQITSVFPNLSVEQNIRVAVISRQQKQFDFWNNLESDRALNEAIREILNLVGIETLAKSPVSLLSHGDRSLVELAIVLALKPNLILLDEPTAGMSREETQRIVQLIKHLQQSTDCTFLITEHDLDVVFNLAESIVVMHQGKIIAKGNYQEISDSSEVRRVYLGT
ncbi:MAG: ABC transporter ATP-binding protein [Xenococcaceae cyanobacterium MO_188.B29]|nr:ABC transporter ATP-binding protein [Xenococcaceae cyanobacterium MO_188.B29]